MEKNDFLNFQTAVKLHGILHKNQRNIWTADQINNESINKRWKKNVDNKIERRIKEDWKSFMHARIHKKERMKLTNVNHLCKN